jgi:GNAT superfamily N-acetyltransferase
MDDAKGDQLRQMAEHRGLKLIKSRRRKAGVGDYGKFGLTDASGKALLGIGEDGLTASADDVEEYLRTNALGTWKRSAATMPNAPTRPKPPRQADDAEDDPSVRRKARVKARRSIQALPDELSTPSATPEGSEKRQPKSEPKAPLAGRKAAPASDPAAEPELSLRPARPADGAALAALLSQLNGISIDETTARLNLQALRKAGGGVLLAELEVPIGCCAWAIVPTVHRGPVGRVSAVFVDEDHRRTGIATRLIAAAVGALAEKGCALVEVMSDIEIKNAHNFFRSLKFDQTSYRFARTIDDSASS